MVGQRKKKMEWRERGDFVNGRGARGLLREKGEARTNYQFALPTLFYLFGPSCSGIGVASLIRCPNSKFNSR